MLPLSLSANALSPEARHETRPSAVALTVVVGLRPGTAPVDHRIQASAEVGSRGLGHGRLYTHTHSPSNRQGTSASASASRAVRHQPSNPSLRHSLDSGELLLLLHRAQSAIGSKIAVHSEIPRGAQQSLGCSALAVADACRCIGKEALARCVIREGPASGRTLEPALQFNGGATYSTAVMLAPCEFPTGRGGRKEGCGGSLGARGSGGGAAGIVQKSAKMGEQHRAHGAHPYEAKRHAYREIEFNTSQQVAACD